MNINPESRIRELGLELPPVPKPAGVYKPVVASCKFLYVSGQVPLNNDGTLICGTLGKDMDVEAGKKAARQAGLTMLSTIKEHFGDLGRLRKIVKTLGMVNCTPDFGKHPAVINGFSELMAEVFGEENGIGARSAVGMMLPNNIAVEIEAVFEIDQENEK